MTNLHGTAIIIGERGLLITGPSGSGKTTLALALIEQFAGRGLLCRLIGDDQLLTANHSGRLVCTVPETLAGLVEVPGIGPQSLAYEPAAVIDLLVRLVPASVMARFQEPGMEMVAGCRISQLDLAARNVTAAVPAIAARLALDHFGIE
ncbi:HPr kinase/phosphorylase [Manganibacter manganicus]|uniref:Serine kinase n=1 Tax=Manganibacter manganicus TaxID=1873176 RepID=A0A1V8RL88_9HYPH|nr:serine kinase [Pseudaminobacter manganicus]OQM73962.1 serine kinase [Pseudaminobacter manganicus]